MQDVKALIVKNDLNLPSESVDSLLRRFLTKSISYLSPEKEAFNTDGSPPPRNAKRF